MARKKLPKERSSGGKLRLVVYMDEKQYVFLRDYAEKRGLSMSALGLLLMFERIRDLHRKGNLTNGR
jgi:hypothetical protein